MTTEEQNPETRNLDQKSVEEIIKVINNEDKKVAFAVEKELPNIEKAVNLIVEVLSNGGKVYFVGAGTSGRLGIIQQAEVPPTFNDESFKAFIAGGNKAVFNAREGAEDNKEEGYKVIKKNVTPKDIVIGLSASGKTPYVVGALEKALEIRCKTIAISCNYNSRISSLSDVAITLVVGPEIIAGSTRMKAGTAQKMVLDILTTTAMIRLGKVYDNLMIDVKATNKKLKERAKTIVIKIADVNYSKAEELLEKTNYNIKSAVIMAKKGCTAEEAKTLLIKNKGALAKCL